MKVGLGWSAKECWITDDLPVEGMGGDPGLVGTGPAGGWYPMVSCHAVSE